MMLPSIGRYLKTTKKISGRTTSEYSCQSRGSALRQLRFGRRAPLSVAAATPTAVASVPALVRRLWDIPDILGRLRTLGKTPARGLSQRWSDRRDPPLHRSRPAPHLRSPW